MYVYRLIMDGREQTGIFDFLNALPEQILNAGLTFQTVGEAMAATSHGFDRSDWLYRDLITWMRTISTVTRNVNSSVRLSMGRASS